MRAATQAAYSYFKPRCADRRAAFEFYPTPPSAIRALLSVERFEGDIWEPACGDGAIGRELVHDRYDVIATDITDWGYGYPGYDFLTLDKPFARNIVTNPPYGFGLADRFVDKALRFTAETGGRAAMLLNIASLCHPKRHESFLSSPPRRECLNFRFEDTPEGEFIETVIAAQSQLERQQNSRQVRQKMRARVMGGYWVFRNPYGYRF